MMKKYTKLLALLLAAVMVFTMLPFALADEAQMPPSVREVAAAEPQTEGVTQTGEETPSVSLALDSSLSEGAKDELAALETAEKEEPLVGAMESKAEQADAVWSYTTEDGTQTFYYAELADAYKYGLVPDTAASMETAGTLKLLKDWSIDNNVGSVNGSTATGAATAGNASGQAVLDFPGKMLNIDFNGHTIQVTTPSDSDDRATLIRLGRGNLDLDYNVHIFSSAKDADGNPIRGTFTKNKNKSAMRGLVMDYGGGSGARNVLIENMNVTTIKNEPVINLMGTENNLTLRNSTVTAASSTYGAVTIDAPTCETTTKIVTNVTLEDSALVGNLAGLMLLNCKKNAVTNYTTDYTCSLTIKGDNVITCDTARRCADHHGVFIAANTDGTAKDSSLTNISPDTALETVTTTTAGGAPVIADWALGSKQITELCDTAESTDEPASSGDINGDGTVSTKDITALRRYLAGGYGIAAEETVCDVNGDGTVSTKDITTLRRYLAGGYGITLGGTSAQSVKIDLKNETTLYKTYGRTYMVDYGANLLWPGDAVEFTAACEGDITMRYAAGEDVYLRVYVDGAEVGRPVAGIAKTSLTVAKGLASGTHTIRLVRDSDISKANYGFVMRSFEFTGDKSSVTAPAQKDLLIEFVGDSITAGKYTIPELGEPGQHSATNSYSYLTAQALDADWINTARGGIGVLRTTANGGGACPKTMAQCYDYVNPFAADADLIEYGFDRKADVVIMALGTNDSTSKIAEADFIAATEDLIDQIRNRNGAETKVVVLCGMMSNSRNAHLKTVADETGSYYLQVTIDNAGGNNHPSVAGHAKIAEELTAYLRDTVLTDA